LIAVLDYGIGNLRSAEKALQHVGADARLVADPDEAAAASGFVLPGVGAFGSCAAALTASGLAEVVKSAVARGAPCLAVCIGMQLLFEGSDESPDAPGLGLLGGRVRLLSAEVRKPQMQWNVVQPGPADFAPMLEATPEWYYFVHSYAVEPTDPGIVAGTCDYGGPVIAAVRSGNLFGTQFHPEKSGRAGLGLLRRFADDCGG
jgi:glutamine amidotransferase